MDSDNMDLIDKVKFWIGFELIIIFSFIIGALPFILGWMKIDQILNLIMGSILMSFSWALIPFAIYGQYSLFLYEEKESDLIGVDRSRE